MLLIKYDKMHSINWINKSDRSYGSRGFGSVLVRSVRVRVPRSGRPSKFTPRSDGVMLRETEKNPRAASGPPQASVGMLMLKFMTVQLETD